VYPNDVDCGDDASVAPEELIGRLKNSSLLIAPQVTDRSRRPRRRL